MISITHINQEIDKIEEVIKNEKNTAIKASLKSQVLTIKLLRDQRTNQLALLKAIVDIINSVNTDKNKTVNLTDYTFQPTNQPKNTQ